MSNEEKKLDELELNAAELRNTRNTLFEEIKRHRSQRDQLNDSAKQIREEAYKHRDERDRINARVQEIKQKLGPLFDRLNEKKEQLSEANRSIRQEYRNMPDKRRLERDLQRIEWEMMTTPTREMLNREEELVARAASLRQSLEGYKSVQKQEDETSGLVGEKRITEKEIGVIRDEISGLAETSQEHHEKMIVFFEQADVKKKEADEAHGRYVEKIKEAEVIKEQLNVVMPQVRELREKLNIADKRVTSRRMMGARDRKAQMRQEALRKMEAGEKLTFDDVQLIYGDGEEEILDSA